jgi:hypothetical protein
VEPTTSRQRSRHGLLALWAILSLSVSTPPAVAQAVRQQQPVAHANVWLVVTPSGHDRSTAPASAAAAASGHRLAVILRDTATGAAIPDAHVRVNVAEKGFAGTYYTLGRDVFEGVPAYTGSVSMPGRTPYRLLVQVMLPRVDRTLEAQFEYRHHH